MNDFQIQFTERLAFLLEAGISLLTALEVLESQASGREQRIIMEVSAGVLRGLRLEAALSKTKVFGSFTLHAVRIGEVTGTLAQNLRYVAEELKKHRELRRKVIGALMYPMFLSIAGLAICIVLLIYIFPKILPIFKSVNMPLPASTKVLIFVSDTLSHEWWAIGLGAIVTVLVLVICWKKVPICRHYAHIALLFIPIVSQLTIKSSLATITRTLGLLMKAGVPLDEAIKVVGKVIGHSSYKEELANIGQACAGGERLSTCCARRPRLFHPLCTRMITIGELSGNLSETLLSLSRMYEDEIGVITKHLSTSVEPILMLCMGLGVGFIAMAIISPIYGITQNLHH